LFSGEKFGGTPGIIMTRSFLDLYFSKSQVVRLIELFFLIEILRFGTLSNLGVPSQHFCGKFQSRLPQISSVCLG